MKQFILILLFGYFLGFSEGIQLRDSIYWKYLDSVSVGLNQPVFTIKYSDYYIQIQNQKYQVLQSFFEELVNEPNHLTLKDYNFDGYLDIRGFDVCGSRAQCYSSFFLYNPELKMFEYHEPMRDLMLISFDFEKKLVHSFSRDYDENYEDLIYKFETPKKLKLLFKERREHVECGESSALNLTHHYIYRYKEDSDSLELEQEKHFLPKCYQDYSLTSYFFPQTGKLSHLSDNEKYEHKVLLDGKFRSEKLLVLQTRTNTDLPAKDFVDRIDLLQIDSSGEIIGRYNLVQGRDYFDSGFKISPAKKLIFALMLNQQDCSAQLNSEDCPIITTYEINEISLEPSFSIKRIDTIWEVN